MGRWNKNRKPVGRIMIMTEEGNPALVFDLENGKLKPDGPKILGTPGYGQLNNNVTKSRTEKQSSRRGKQNYGTLIEKSNTNTHASQNLIKTSIRNELDQSIKALQIHQQKENIFQQPSKDYLYKVPPARSIYSPPPPPSSPNEISRHFTLSATQNLTYTNHIQRFDSLKNNPDIVVSLQDAELQPIQFYTDDNVFDFEFLKQDDFLHITDMSPTFQDMDPLTGSLPEIDYLNN
ncbi:hypothetical protein M9Y10_033799 [Tritrichomonas musculus]|uniref:Uncharacterized protein n=1 Tax=Tritrichomonas musculus TaxID=1915356 RepID=A0ABR2KE59_9EUKA